MKQTVCPNLLLHRPLLQHPADSLAQDRSQAADQQYLLGRQQQQQPQERGRQEQTLDSFSLSWKPWLRCWMVRHPCTAPH